MGAPSLRSMLRNTRVTWGGGTSRKQVYVLRCWRSLRGRTPFAVVACALELGISLCTGKTLALTVGGDGSVNYDSVVKQGANQGRTVHSKFTALIPKPDQAKDLVRPSEEDQEATMKDTQAALDKLLGNKLAVLQTKAVPKQPGEAEYIK